MSTNVLMFPLTDERKKQLERRKVFELVKADTSTTNLTFAKPHGQFTTIEELSSYLDKTIHVIGDMGKFQSFILKSFDDKRWQGQENFSPFRKVSGTFDDVNITSNHNAHHLFASYSDASDYSVALSTCPLHRAEVDAYQMCLNAMLDHS